MTIISKRASVQSRFTARAEAKLGERTRESGLTGMWALDSRRSPDLLGVYRTNPRPPPTPPASTCSTHFKFTAPSRHDPSFIHCLSLTTPFFLSVSEKQNHAYQSLISPRQQSRCRSGLCIPPLVCRLESFNSWKNFMVLL